jgi:uncharacterized membrane protein
MEYILLIVIILLLILQNTKNTQNSTSLRREINQLNEKLNNLHSLLITKKTPKTVEDKSAKAIIKIEVEKPSEVPVKATPSANLEAREEDYTPSYPKVISLSDKDASTIKDILRIAESTKDYSTLIKLRHKIVEALEINEVKEKSDIEFIRTLLEDYNYYTQKQLIVTPPTPLDTKEEKPIEPVKVVASKKTVMTAKPIEKVVYEPTLSIWGKFKQRNPDLEKFIGENLINKIGILILVLGISYFVKYAIDKDWINEPARVGIGVLAGSLVLFIAHKLRQKYASFSSVLVAGAIAIFYFTIAIAFHEYKLFGQEIAFAIMVVITAFSCLISLSYNRMELAILSLIGGFLVPFMVSSGSGNYIVLFTYIAILDIGILALAYFKKWQLLHILSFIFTMLLFGGWVLTDTYSKAPHHLGALIFGFVFYIIFIITNIINNLRTKGSFSNNQLAMLTINNFVFYGIGMLVLSRYNKELAGLFTAFLAVLNMGYSLLLYKKFGLDKRGIYLLIGLSLTFITLAIPVQFSGNSITIFWAIEAIMLMWLAQKSQIKSYRFVAIVVQSLMLCSLMLDWFVYFKRTDLSLVSNPVFIAGIIVISSLVGVNYLLRHETEKLSRFGLQFNPKTYRDITRIFAIITGYFVGLFEVIYQAQHYYEFNGVLSLSGQYHLLFTAVFCFIVFKNRTAVNERIINALAILNIIVFTFIFARIPFSEFQDNIVDGTNQNISYYLHMLSIIFIMFFWYLIYDSNKKEKVFAVFNHKLAIWCAAFILVVLTSTEVVLQGLHLMNFSTDELRLNSQYGPIYEMIASARYKIIKTGLPVLWGILAFILLLWGIKKQIQQLRIIALALLGITIVKLFVYDISNVSETGKIIAFILLGVLILIISFIYQKIKVLVIDEEKTTINDKID